MLQASWKETWRSFWATYLYRVCKNVELIWQPPWVQERIGRSRKKWKLAVPFHVAAAISCFFSVRNLALIYTIGAWKSHKATLAGFPSHRVFMHRKARTSNSTSFLPPSGGDVGKCQQQLTIAILQLLEQLHGASADLENIRILLNLLWIISQAEPAGFTSTADHAWPSQTHCQDFLFYNSNPSAHRKKTTGAGYLFQRTELQGCWLSQILNLGGSEGEDYLGAATSIFSCFMSISLASDWQCFRHFNQLLPSFSAKFAQILCFCQSSLKFAFQSFTQSKMCSFCHTDLESHPTELSWSARGEQNISWNEALH